jgi:hypothetical protein
MRPALRQVLLGGGARQYTGLVATRGRVATNFNGTNKQIMSRTFHVARDTLSSIRLVLGNWYALSNTSPVTEAGSGAAATFTASIEYPSGTFTQVLFSGSATGNVSDGATLVSDATAVNIPIGATFWVRNFFQSTGGILFTNVMFSGATTDAAAYNTSGVTDQTMSGTITNRTSGIANPPIAVIGLTRKKSYLLISDSRGYGVGDTPDATGDTGFLARPIGPNYAYINAGVSADEAAWGCDERRKAAGVGAICFPCGRWAWDQ